MPLVALEGSNDAKGSSDAVPVTAVAVDALVALECSNGAVAVALEGSNDAEGSSGAASIGFGRRVYFLLTTRRGERAVRSIDSTLSSMGSITSIVT